MAKGKKRKVRGRGRGLMRGIGELIPSPGEIIMPVAGGAVYNVAVGAAAKFVDAGDTVNMLIGGFAAWFVGKKLMGNGDFATGALGALGNDLASSFNLRKMVGVGDYLSDYLRDGVASSHVQFGLPDGSRAIAGVGDVAANHSGSYRDSD